MAEFRRLDIINDDGGRSCNQCLGTRVVPLLSLL
jgi:hypothetical protein